MRALASSPPVMRTRSGFLPTSGKAMVARSAHTVRDATEEDLPRLLALWEDIRPTDPRRGARAPGRGEFDAARAAVELRFRAALIDPEQRMLVVVAPESDAGGGCPERVVAMALLTVEWTGRRGETRAATLNQYLVDARYRRRGAGRALVAAAMDFAESRGIDTVAVNVHPDHRETNRYFARMGFVPAVTRRVAPLSLLRRSLLPVDPPGVDVGAQRLRLRLRGPVDPVAVQARVAARKRACI
jgi:GNAT superfamily N-acetyltransferase